MEYREDDYLTGFDFPFQSNTLCDALFKWPLFICLFFLNKKGAHNIFITAHIKFRLKGHMPNRRNGRERKKNEHAK